MAIERGPGGTTFTGVHIKVYQMTGIAVALRFYAKHKMPVNRAYTPKRMMDMARKLTGGVFGPRDYLRAATVLEDTARELAANDCS